eukprot:10693772-Ditylum_brightwellii.AAC.1
MKTKLLPKRKLGRGPQDIPQKQNSTLTIGVDSLMGEKRQLLNCLDYVNSTMPISMTPLSPSTTK